MFKSPFLSLRLEMNAHIFLDLSRPTVKIWKGIEYENLTNKAQPRQCAPTLKWSAVDFLRTQSRNRNLRQNIVNVRQKMCTLSQLFSSLHLIFFSLELKIIGESFQCVRFDVWGFLSDLFRKVWNYEGIKMMTCLRILAGVSSKLSASEIENHLEQGKQLLSLGQLSDALVHYHAAVGK